MTRGTPSRESADAAQKILAAWRDVHTKRPQHVAYSQDRHDQLNLALEQTLAFALELHRRLKVLESKVQPEELA